jgi:hypothetical protein
MPAWRAHQHLGIKLVTVTPMNRERDLPTVHALYVLSDTNTGIPLAIIDGEVLTLRRTAAVSALASRFLSRRDSRTLLMVGTGRLAPEMVVAHCTARHLQRATDRGLLQASAAGERECDAFETHVDFAKANVIASFDSDFLAVDGNNLRNAKTWGDRRRNPKAGEPMSRLYVYETCFSSTGTVADHRFPMKAQDVTAALLQLAAELGVGDGNDLGAALKGFKADNNKIRAIAKDLKSAGGNCAVVVGPRQPAAAHAVAHAINQALGAVGKTVAYTSMPAQLQGNVAAIKNLAAAIEAGQVKALVCLGTNPAYDAPADLNFGSL